MAGWHLKSPPSLSVVRALPPEHARTPLRAEALAFRIIRCPSFYSVAYAEPGVSKPLSLAWRGSCSSNSTGKEAWLWEEHPVAPRTAQGKAAASAVLSAGCAQAFLVCGQALATSNRESFNSRCRWLCGDTVATHTEAFALVKFVLGSKNHIHFVSIMPSTLLSHTQSRTWLFREPQHKAVMTLRADLPAIRARWSGAGARKLKFGGFLLRCHSSFLFSLLFTCGFAEPLGRVPDL